MLGNCSLVTHTSNTHVTNIESASDYIKLTLRAGKDQLIKPSVIAFFCVFPNCILTNQISLFAWLSHAKSQISIRLVSSSTAGAWIDDDIVNNSKHKRKQRQKVLLVALHELSRKITYAFNFEAAIEWSLPSNRIFWATRAWRRIAVTLSGFVTTEVYKVAQQHHRPSVAE